MAADGLITIPSHCGTKDTTDRLNTAIFLLVSITRQEPPRQGYRLRPTELLIFGNANGGTPLMQSNQTIGIDLPLRALVWQDAAGKTWLSYNDPSWRAKRHDLGSQVDPAITAVAAGVSAIAREAIGSS